MFRSLATLALICASLQFSAFANAASSGDQNPTQPVNAVIEWNRTLLVIVRTPGAQPATIHSTRNFAILHAAIYDAVNNIELSSSPYLVRLSHVPRTASKIAAADQAAHDVLVFLYPAFQASLDGFIDSTTRTAEQTEIGKFWNGNIQDFWNEIAQTAALQRHLNLEHSARLFALLNISLADTAIALFDAKYTYNFWRPVTAVQLAGSDGNPESEPNPAWLPLSRKTAPDPSYPGAHSAISKAGSTVLGLYFGDQFSFDVSSESLAGVSRHFTSFAAAAEEAGLSRIYAGQHFRTDHISGKSLGSQVAESIDKRILHRKE